MNQTDPPEHLIRRAGTNLSYKTLTLVVLQGLSFLFYVALARFLGEEDFGRYSLAYSVGAILVILVDPGLNQLTIREISRNPARTSVLGNAVLTLKIGASLIVLGLIFLIVPWVPGWGEMRDVVFLMTLSLVGLAFLEFFSALFNAYERMQMETGILGFTKLGVVSGAILALSLGADLKTLLIAVAGLHLAGVFFGYRTTRSRITPLVPRWDTTLFRNTLAEAFPMVLTTVFIVILYRIDVVMLSLFSVREGSIGFYAASVKIMDVLMACSVIFMAAIFPVLSRTLLTAVDPFLRYFWQGFGILAALALVLMGTIALLSDPVIRLIYGEAFQEAGRVLRVLLLALPFSFLRHFLLNVLVVFNLQRKNAWATGFAAFGNIALNLVLIPLWGVYGAAVATVVTDLGLCSAVFVVCLFEIRKYKRGELGLQTLETDRSGIR
jgi:O-antigen/teichoic acid export membrane protein